MGICSARYDEIRERRKGKAAKVLAKVQRWNLMEVM
jgi:hypothetical protein